MSDIGVGSLGTPSVNNEFQSEALQNLDKDAFLELLVAQMRYQNPMSPVDSQQYLAQAAQYASVEQLENMASSQAELRSMQMVSIATELVGQEVTALDPFTGQPLTGTVSGVRFGTEPILLVDGAEVPLSAVITVGDVPTAETPTGDTTDSADGADTGDTSVGTDDADTGGDTSVGTDEGALQENDVTPDDGSGVSGFEAPVGSGPDSAAAA